MKISQVSNQNHTPAFKATLKAPPDFWDAIQMNKLSRRKARQVTKALETIRDITTWRTIRLDRGNGRGGVFWEYFAAAERRNGPSEVIAIKKNTLNPFLNWASFLINIAKKLEKTNESDKFSKLLEQVMHK